MAGGKIVEENGNTLHGDHAYAFYQIPVKAKKYPLVFLHGYGQSGKSWETTPDGRDGLSVEQFLHQMTSTFLFNQKIISAAMVEVFENSGDGILITHSAGGGPGWETAIKTEKVKAVISLELGTFPFPEGEVPEVEKTSSPFPAKGQEVSMEEFLKLTKIPIVVFFGDNIPSGEKISENWGFDNWRVRLNLAKKWETVMKKYGGDVEIVYLPDIGITGNTHFLMADLNNLEIANVMEKWLKSKGLAK